jgi:hypothetical protein
MGRISSLLFVFIWAFCAAWADDGASSGLTGSVQLLDSHPTIRMVSEVVRVSLPKAKVRASFVFRNEGPATTVRMAFPEEGYGDVTTPTSQGDSFEFFRSYVDGKRVKVTRVVDKERTGEAEYHVWWVKRVHFGRGQTRRVVCEYEGGGSRSSYGWYGWSYTLKTGASWKGTIGRARIICDIRGLEPYCRLKIRPAGYRRRGNTVVWDFRNFKPKKDIDFSWQTAFLDVVVNGMPITRHRSKGKVYDIDWWSADWGFPYAVRKGTEVYAPVDGIAAWLGAELNVVKTARLQDPVEPRDRDPAPLIVRLTRGERWVELRRSSKTMKTSSGTVLLPRAAHLAHGYESITTALTPVVRALGVVWIAPSKSAGKVEPAVRNGGGGK